MTVQCQGSNLFQGSHRQRGSGYAINGFIQTVLPALFQPGGQKLGRKKGVNHFTAPAFPVFQHGQVNNTVLFNNNTDGNRQFLADFLEYPSGALPLPPITNPKAIEAMLHYFFNVTALLFAYPQRLRGQIFAKVLRPIIFWGNSLCFLSIVMGTDQQQTQAQAKRGPR